MADPQTRPTISKHYFAMPILHVGSTLELVGTRKGLSATFWSKFENDWSRILRNVELALFWDCGVFSIIATVFTVQKNPGVPKDVNRNESVTTHLTPAGTWFYKIKQVNVT
jgi:hypothetical protein